MFKIESKRLAAGETHSRRGIFGQIALEQDKANKFNRPTAVSEAAEGEGDPESDFEDSNLDGEIAGADELESRGDQSADHYFTLGSTFGTEGEWDRAVEAYSQAIRLNPRDPEALSNRALMHLQRGEFSKSIDDCSESLDLDPGQLPALCCRAHCYVWLRRYAEALLDLSEAIRLDKRHAEIHYLRGLAHVGLGKNRKALADLKKAWRYAPTDASIYLARSRVYESLGKTKYAAADLAEAIRREPQWADRTVRENLLAGRPPGDRRA